MKKTYTPAPSKRALENSGQSCRTTNWGVRLKDAVDVILESVAPSSQ